MEWYVYYYDFNNNVIEPYNIFRHCKFSEDVKELLRQNLSKQDFADKLNVLVRYYFWSKAEWEVIISSFIGNAEDKKVDVYNQIYLNWDKFVNYVWSVKNGGAYE